MDSDVVAIKVLNSSLDSDEGKDLMKEAIIMAQVDHPHVIKLHGVVTTGKSMMLVLEYAQNNSLEKFLRASRIVELTTAAKQRVAADIAAGMNHLEGVSMESCCVCVCAF